MPEQIDQNKIRNVAIIAHVDHGKTTLVDAFLKQSNLFRSNQQEMGQEQILDTGDLEREKGITITAKNIAVRYKDYKINIIDTPGHADFAGEVERTLNMADGCLLVVDAQEGPMPQTKFVLKKALELNLTPILVINKIDKQFANPAKAISKVQDLFLDLASNEDQLNFPVFYAIGRDGKAFAELPEDLSTLSSQPANIYPLLDAIVQNIPAPKGDVNGKFQMQITSLAFDSHLGRFLIGKINRGKVSPNDSVVIVNSENNDKESGKIKKVLVREGLEFKEVNSASAGEIIALLGIETTAIGATICDPSTPDPLPMIKISDPSVKIKFEANTSPFVGQDGEFVTAKQLQQRLDKEGEVNIGLKITKGDAGSYYVAGRGELQLAILIETLRREGYEFQVRKPEIIFKEVNGVKCEPMEEVFIEVPSEYQGTIVTALSEAKGQLISMEVDGNQIEFKYHILTRNLLGLRNNLLTKTKGNLIMNNYLLEYIPVTEQDDPFRKGVLIASETGEARGYSLNTIQERGDLFIGNSTKVYEGMIVGINKFEQDMEVNVTKERQKSGVRMKHDEITQTNLRPIIPITLEFALVFLAKDEILEVTPNYLRLRKAFLTKNERTWASRKNLSEYAKQQLGVN